MLIAGFPAGSFAANCYVVATGDGAECVVVDPGEGAAEGVDELIEQRRLTPAAVLLTHGHLDHVWSAATLSDRYGVPSWIHPADRHLLSDPLAGLPAEWAGSLRSLGPALPDREPREVRELTGDTTLAVAGLEFTVEHVPGHTSGSVQLRLSTGEPSTGDTDVVFSGDLLFAGSIGRTDLPGGDHDTMRRSLAEKVLPLADSVTVLPGHGEQTTIGRERATNAFLRDLAPTP